ncbi:hypothetical protein D0Z07_2773 [Hyphodiscus hymeniophilus]|uniref:Uncharacterized protein n=1 Tax=Hyphodiscus hymeniophilus TaxID=353542 RepID=A0A9P6VNG1_9HELO|nr:hypothetical protein D0Z07_2773 [Hyphodiscus hymeniophilus]
MSSVPRSASTNLRAPPAMEGPKESAVSRLLITPLTFISFLLSLAFIDSRNHSIRTHSHPRAQPSTILGHIKAFLHSCVYECTDSSPYAYISETSTSTTGMKKPAGRKEDEKWYWHTKQRKMMKAEFSDAFRMRRSVLVVSLASVVVISMGLVYGVKEAVGWVNRVSTNKHNGGQAGHVLQGEQLVVDQKNDL